MDKNMIDKEIKDGTFKTFKKLLKNGIGTRTQTQFAKETGISRGNINRMLNQIEIQKPSKKMLLTLAAHMHSVSAKDLLESCGYEMADVNETAKDVKEDIIKVLSNAVGDIYEDMIKKLEDLSRMEFPYLNGCTWIPTTESGQIPEGAALKGRDFNTMEFCWDYGKYCGRTFVTIGSTDTGDGQHVLCGFTMDIDEMAESSFIYDRKSNISAKNITVKDIDKETSCVIEEYRENNNVYSSAESSFLNSIFKNTGYYKVTNFGCGFYYKETPENFKDFVMSNAEYFCVSKETQDLYQRLLNDEDPDEVFKDYGGHAKWEECGTGWAIADILTNKTGQDFLYFIKDEERRGEDPDDSCIMCPFENHYFDDELFDKDVLKATYEAALALGIKKFGMVYYEQMMKKDGRQEYDTDSFHYEYVNKSDVITDKEVLRKLKEDAGKVALYYRQLDERQYTKEIGAGRIETAAGNALENLNDIDITQEMVDYITEEMEKLNI